MNIIRHRIRRRLPELFCITECGLEFEDYGLPVGDVILQPVFVQPEPAFIEGPIWPMPPQGQMTMCIVCERRPWQWKGEGLWG